MGYFHSQAQIWDFFHTFSRKRRVAMNAKSLNQWEAILKKEEMATLSFVTPLSESSLECY